jgi:hypothetical protein
MNRKVLSCVACLLLTITACGLRSNQNASTGADKTRKITANGKTVMVAENPTAVTNLLKSLITGKATTFRIERSQIDAAQLQVLDKAAAEVTGVSDCKILSVEGCNSCCADGVSSSLRHTTCGDFCDKVCGAEPCH